MCLFEGRDNELGNAKEGFSLYLAQYLCSALVCYFQPLQEPLSEHSKAPALAGLGSGEIPSKLKLQEHFVALWSLSNWISTGVRELCCYCCALCCKQERHIGSVWQLVLLILSSSLQTQLIMDVKALTRILFLYTPLPMFWALLDQQVGIVVFKVTSPSNYLLLIGERFLRIALFFLGLTMDPTSH